MATVIHDGAYEPSHIVVVNSDYHYFAGTEQAVTFYEKKLEKADDNDYVDIFKRM